MKRREFLISSALGSVGLGASRRPLGRVHVRRDTPASRRAATHGHAQDSDRRRRIQYRLHPLHGDADRQEAPEAALPSDRVGRLAERHHYLVPQLRPARRRAVVTRELHRQLPPNAKLGRRLPVGGRHRRVRRQHAESAGHLAGAGHRRDSQASLGSWHRPRRRQRRLAVLVRGRHDRLASQRARRSSSVSGF